MCSALVAVLALTADLWFAAHPLVAWRSVVAFTLAIAFLAAHGWNRESLGLRITPIQPVRSWLVPIAIISVGLAIILAALFVAANLLEFEMVIPRVAPEHAFRRFLQMCVHAPLLEETVYRLMLCVAVAGVIGPRTAIAASGLVFAALHFIYGNPSPENQLGGFILAWAYMKSGSLGLPVMLHALGNLAALAIQFAAWFLLP